MKTPCRALLTPFLSTLALAACSRAPLHPVRLQWPVMGTVAAVQCADPATAPQARDIAQNVFADIDREFSSWNAGSALSAVNLAAGSGHPVPVSPRFADLLGTALDFSRQSGGTFNPLIGPVMRVWGFHGTASRPSRPSDSELAAALSLADCRLISLSPAHALMHVPTLSLSRAGMSLDLGAIAKGYAVDLAYERLKAAGHTNLLVDLGGNLRAIGEAAPGRGGWRTGVRNPFVRNALIASFLLRDGEATATSGNYERFVEIGGIRHTHIMDGRTGHPVAGMASVTVIAPDAATADGLSTALFVLGPKESAGLLRHHPRCEAFWIPDSPDTPAVLATPGFAARLTPAGDTPYTLSVTPHPVLH